ncbi:hypothetical protein CDCA_CDCA02G0778 [Cyanidium caldarium]|uniref:Uncharacterized protein n=1 Tax=Cyanidium caldarium TaxID=2771 RepID=A0AAV9IS78_CYACA|nr:hypothetical protein CDCA_CDCA02G0778 [Cyanidium caldarium]
MPPGTAFLPGIAFRHRPQRFHLVRPIQSPVHPVPVARCRRRRRRPPLARPLRAMLDATLQEVASAFAGGCVGVMGTLIALELLKTRIRERKQCPYCAGRGRLVCGQCYALGHRPAGDGHHGANPCNQCDSSGYVTCNHCEGSGSLLPFEAEQALLKSYEDEWIQDDLFQ